jgi:hypothetical protein
MEKIVRKYKLGEEPSEYEYWKTRTYLERLSTIEFLRSQFYQVNDNPPRLQRLFKIVKPAKG